MKLIFHRPQGWRIILVIFLSLLLSRHRQATAYEEETAHYEELSDGVLTVITYPVPDGFFSAPVLTGDGSRLTKLGTIENFHGLDVDLMHAFGTELGARVEFRSMAEAGFSVLIPALIERQGDIVASALTITEERSEVVDFSRPYFRTGLSVMTLADSDLHTPEQLAGLIGSAVRGSTGIDGIRRLGAEAIAAEFAFEALEAVDSGEADFTLMDTASTRTRMVHGLKVAFELPDSEQEYGFALRKGSDLRARLDLFLDQAERSGRLRALTEKYGLPWTFGPSEPEASTP